MHITKDGAGGLPHGSVPPRHCKIHGRPGGLTTKYFIHNLNLNVFFKRESAQALVFTNVAYAETADNDNNQRLKINQNNKRHKTTGLLALMPHLI